MFFCYSESLFVHRGPPKLPPFVEANKKLLLHAANEKNVEPSSGATSPSGEASSCWNKNWHRTIARAASRRFRCGAFSFSWRHCVERETQCTMAPAGECAYIIAGWRSWQHRRSEAMDDDGSLRNVSIRSTRTNGRRMI